MGNPETWVEINTQNILHNLKQFRKIIGKEKILMPVVKSNAYGHGVLEVSKKIVQSKIADKLAVVNSQEALYLRKNKIKFPIIILSYWSEQDAKKLTATEFVVYDMKQAKFLNNLKKNIKVHLKLDTGTSRLGLLKKEFIALVKAVSKMKNLEIAGVFTHYANSEEDNEFTRAQTKQLLAMKGKLEALGIKTKYHSACSAAAISNPQTILDGLRLGISLYGLWPSDFSRISAKHKYPWLRLKPALTWKTRIIQVKDIPKDHFIGYGCTYLAKKRLKMAVLPVGYNEGYDRGLSGSGEVLVRNQRCPILGRVCMNLTMIDVSKLKQVKPGDEAILLGRQIAAEELAQKIGTINYEVVTRINPLLSRIYIK